MGEVRCQNRQATVTVKPTAAPLVLKALKEPPRDRKKVKNVEHKGNLKMDDIIEIAKLMRPKSYAAEFVGIIKEISAAQRTSRPKSTAARSQSTNERAVSSVP